MGFFSGEYAIYSRALPLSRVINGVRGVRKAGWLALIIIRGPGIGSVDYESKLLVANGLLLTFVFETLRRHELWACQKGFSLVLLIAGDKYRKQFQ